MQSNLNQLAVGRESPGARELDQVQQSPRVSRSVSEGVRRLRSDESWIEVSSQPSSSSLSSIDGANLAALGVHLNQHGRRRRRLVRNEHLRQGLEVRSSSIAGSSQEEYEESESESDRVMTSSNENIENQPEGISPPALLSSTSEEASSINAEEEDDENATALGVNNIAPVFTPQPNAFTHPPQSSATRHTRSVETRPSYFPAHGTSLHRRPSAHSYPSRGARTSHTPYNMISPSHQADHDAALRASLSTLLSCAAAARGLPKREAQSTQRTNTGPPNRIEPSTLRLVPEATITGLDNPPQLPPRPLVRPRPSATSLSSNDKGKRKASASKDRSKKKPRRANSPSRDASSQQTVHPTLMTWVVSAGVVVLFSAISFSAGYAIGREVGRLETGAVGGRDGVVCGKEVGRGLRRLKWGTGSVSVIRV